MSEERFDYEVDDATRFVDNLKDRVHDLYDKNEELKEEIERLNKGYCKFKEQCGKYATCLRENQIKEIIRLNNIINEIEKCIKDKYYEAIDYQTKIRQSDLMQGNYPVRYYLEEQNEQLCNYFLNRLKDLQELKGSNEPSFEEMVRFVENVYKDIKSQSTLHEELEEERKTIAKIVGDFKEVN